MRIQSDVNNINMNSAARAGADESVRKVSDRDKSAGNGLVLDAGNLNLGAESIEEKRKKAQQMALGIVSEAFDGDKEIDADLDARRQHIRDLNAENYEYTKELKRIDELRSDLVESYGSTEYQQQMLDLDKMQKHWQGEIDKNIKLIKEENAIISGVKLERLKSHEMVDAKKQSDDVLKAASESIIGEIISDAKEHVDEELAEDKEKAEAAEEKAEELKEKLDEARAERKAKEEQLEEMCELESMLDEVSAIKQTENMPDVKKSLESVVNELKLTMQDLAGAVVDDIV